MEWYWKEHSGVFVRRQRETASDMMVILLFLVVGVETLNPRARVVVWLALVKNYLL